MALTICVPVIAPAHAASSPTGRTPKIFWTSQRQDVWNRMRAENHSWWREIKANAELSGTSNARYADLGQWATMAYQVTGDAAYAAKAWAEAGPKLHGGKPDSSRNFTREHFIEFAWMYDWLYPALSSSQRQAWIDSLNYWADLCLGQTSVSWGTRLGDSDETAGHYFGIVLWALASEGGNSRASELLTHSQVGGLDKTSNSRNTMRNAIADYLRRAEGGQWIEATKYNMGTVQLVLMGADGVKTATGSEKFPELAPMRKDFALGFMHEVTSNLSKPFQWGDNEEPRDLNRDRRVSVMTMLAGLLEDDDSIGPVVKSFRDAIQGSEETGFRWMIFGNPYATSSNFRAGLPKDFYAPGMGIMTMRDGWESGRSLFAAHMSPRSTVDHNVQYLSNFMLYRKGEYAVTHVIGYDANEGEHHNAMLLAGLSSMAEGRGPLAHEVGANGDYAYLVGATGGNRYTKGYYNPPPRFLHEWTRSLLYLPSTDQRSDTIVVFDRVNAENPFDLPKVDKYSSSDRARMSSSLPVKRWIIHTPVVPTMTSEAITWQTSGGQTIKVDTLLPADQNRSVYDEAANGLKGTIKTSELKYQVRIAPASYRRWDTFLNVVQAYDSGLAMDNALVASSNQAAKGVLVKRPGHANVLAMFNAAQGPDLPATVTSGGYLETDPNMLARIDANRLLSSGYQVSWASETSSTTVFLADLDPSKQWLVKVDGQSETTLAVSSEGLGRVQVSGSGSHTLVLRASGDLVDTTLPVLSNILVTSITSSSALVSWTTDEPALALVDYGTTSSYGQQAAPTTSVLGVTHSVLLSGLSADTGYHFRVQATDAAGNAARSSDRAFQTLAGTEEPPVEEDPPAVASGLITNLVAGSGKAYQKQTLGVGVSVFIDRSYTFSTIPAQLVGQEVVLTANDDKTLTSPDAVSFTLTEAATVYVAYDHRATSLPSWLIGWTMEPDMIGTTDEPKRLYYKVFPAGAVVLGGNAAAPMVGAGSNYNVIAVPGTGGGTTPQNQPPVLSAVGDKQAAEGQALSVVLSASDPDGDALTFSASNLPSGAVLAGATLSWTPDFTQAGTFPVMVTVSDGSLADSEDITITVSNTNRSPVLAAVGSQTGTEGELLTFTLSATDPDGDTLDYVGNNMPAGATLNSPTFTWTPTSTQAGTYTVSLGASDGTMSDMETIAITIAEAVPVPAPGDLVTNIKTLTGRPLAVDAMAVGKLAYVDRSYTILSVPASLQGKTYLRTANDDKLVNEPDYLKFTLAANAYVYVAFDSRSTQVPVWLNKSYWVKTGEKVVTSDATFLVYRKSQSAGEVSLGSNNMWWQRGAKSHYIVTVVEKP